MILTDEAISSIRAVFEGVYEIKQQASDLSRSATETMKGQAERLAAISGDDPKVVLGSLRKAYKEFVEEKEGKSDTLSEAILINNALHSEIRK